MTATERVQREIDIFFQGYWEGVRVMKEQNKIVKVCELKIDNHTDTADLVAILARAGYRCLLKMKHYLKEAGTQYVTFM